MNIEISCFEAQIKLPALLRGIQAGNRYTITLRGEPVADLIPAEGDKANEVAAAVAQMRTLMLSAEPLKGMDVKVLINDGRV